MHEVVNPFDLSTIGSVPTADWETVDGFLARAKELCEDRNAWMKAHERAAILKKAAAIMEDRFEHLSMQVAAEGGKPLIDARVEVARAINGMELCIEELGTLRGTEIPMGNTAAGDGRFAWTSREPIGPVVAVSAFNHPLNLIVHQVAPAVATGCPVIVKPAGDTPLSAFEFIDIRYQINGIQLVPTAISAILRLCAKIIRLHRDRVVHDLKNVVTGNEADVRFT